MKISGPGQSALLLLNVISILNKFKIPYAIIGAFAASFYGVVRASLDADAIIYLKNKETIEQLRLVLKKKRFTVAYRTGDFKDPVKAVINIEDGFQNRVDLLMGLRGMKNDVFRRAKKTKFMNRSIRIIDREDFVAMKIFAGSSKDLEDVRGVFKVSGKVNLTLLKKLTANYGQACQKTLQRILNE